MPTGTAVLDFGADPAEEASVVVSAPGVTPATYVEPFFMKEATADNGVDEHVEADALCSLIAEAQTDQFTIEAHPIAMLGIGTFNVRWAYP